MRKFLVTGGAGFIGSNLCEYLLKAGEEVTCLDNFATGKFENIEALLREYPERFKLQVGDIRKPEDCRKAVAEAEYVFHEAALGSVPRSINDPQTTNEVNISGFLNMLVAARDAGVRPLSPYAITKYVNELYADVFGRVYGMECIGLRYFNVFGRRQSPDGAYAAVIPKFVEQLMRYESPVINGDGEYSRDFTYIDNVLQMNWLAMNTENPKAVNTVYNTAYGENTTLNQLVGYLKELLGFYDARIADVDIVYGPVRKGDIPHSLASIDKARQLLGYDPRFNMKQGLREAVKWYWENLKRK